MARRKTAAAAPSTPSPAESMVHHDGVWENVLTGHGTSKDPRTASTYAADVLTLEEARELYRGNDMAARVVDKPADAMTRRWVEIQVGDNTKAAAGLKQALDELRARKRFNQAIKWARAYGGAGVVVGADDGQPLSKPLDEKRIREIRFLTAFDCEELQAETWYGNPKDSKYGEVKTYRITPRFWDADSDPRGDLANLVIHESRVLRFEGVVTDREQERSNIHPGWGDSVLSRVNRVLRDFDMGWDSAGKILLEFVLAVFKIEGLSQLVASKQSKTITKRMELIAAQKSVLRGVLLDAKEDFKREGAPLTGVPDLLDRISKRLAAAADMPVTILLGESPAGLAATGSNEIRNWYDHIAGLQPDVVGEPLERLVRLAMLSKAGPTKGQEPEDWTISFLPLWQPTDSEEAEVRTKVANADKTWIDAGVVTPEEVAVSRFPAEGFNPRRMVVDIALREKVLAGLTEDDLKPPVPEPLQPGEPAEEPPGAPAPPLPPPGTPKRKSTPRRE